jgi:SAM-dependent methyltransferase
VGGTFFGEEIAASYDDGLREHGTAEHIDAVVDLLVELADGGAALELAVGTGRIALPLSRRGVRVAGIDISEPMVARLRAKAGVDAVEVAIGDMTTTRVEGEFSLVYLVFNTVNNLVTQDAQVACFENAARHLQPRGRFVVEVGVPALQMLPVGQTIVPFRADAGGFGFDVYDVVTQRFSSQHYVFGESGLRSDPYEFRYTWPSELDLMARIAGLTLEHRFGGWRREPFTAFSTSHVSVWRKP